LHTGWAGITGCSANGLSQYEVDYVLIKSSGLPIIQVDFDVAPVGPIPPVFHSIEESAGDVYVNWFGGALETATEEAMGPYSLVTSNTPYMTPAKTTGMGFYRVRQ
jgi:hypothetical protein